MLEGRRRELQAEVQGKMRDVRATGEVTKLSEVFDAGESSEADIQEDIELALIQMKSETLNKVDDALVIPAAALGKSDRKTKTYTVNVLEVKDGRKMVVPRQVKIGLNNRVQAQVLEGLKEGEEVVVGEATSGSGGGAGRRPGGMF